jgi:6-phosphofructokinase 1
MMRTQSPEGKVGILVGGGPAPGINGVISAVTIEAHLRGFQVLGIFDGWQWLMQSEISQVEDLTTEKVSRIHFEGGSILRTSRANPTRRSEHLDNVLDSLRRLNVRYLVTIGGDDTAFAASQVAMRAGGSIRFAHVPKTIDNDLPLPGNSPTFGFNTARHVGFQLVHNLMVDSRTTNRWYFVVAMGRTSGHLALGIGKAAGATITLIPEEFPQDISLRMLADVLEGAMLKRRTRGRHDGVAIIAEGLLEKIPEDELSAIEGVRIVRDPFGHLRLAEMDLAHILKTIVERRFAERGESLTIVNKNIGYEVRCAPPTASDCEYVRDLGYGAVEFLLNPPDDFEEDNGAMVCIDGGKIRFLRWDELLDPHTKKTRVRLVDINTPSYRIAREYMIRLERPDLEDREMREQLAIAASTRESRVTPEDIQKKFGYLVGL